MCLPVVLGEEARTYAFVIVRRGFREDNHEELAKLWSRDVAQ